MDTGYDAIVVGARCAGAPTAMLLARKGYRVLAGGPGAVPERHRVDPRHPRARASPRCGAGGCSTRCTATGCPPVDTYSFDFGPVRHLRHARGRCDGISIGLRAAADRARQDPGGRRGRAPAPRSASASPSRRSRRGRRRGRDPRAHEAGGRRSSGPGWWSAPTAATRASPGRRRRAQYHEQARCSSGASTPTGATCRSTASRSSSGPTGAWAAIPTNDGLTMLVVGWPLAESAAYKADVEANYLADPRPGARPSPSGCASATREDRFVGGGRAQLLPHAVRARAGRWSATPATPRTRSPPRGSPTPSATPSCAPSALDEAFSRLAAPSTTRWPTTSGPRRRGAADLRVHRPSWPRCEPPPPEMQQLLGRHPPATRTAMDDFVSVTAGTVSPAEFFAPANLGE